MRKMDASRPLLEKERDGYEENGSGTAHHATATGYDCLTRLFPASSVTSDSSDRDSFGSGGGYTSPTKSNNRSNGYQHLTNHGQSVYAVDDKVTRRGGNNSNGFCSECSEWYCWKWIFPDRIMDYDDFATSAQVCIHALVYILIYTVALWLLIIIVLRDDCIRWGRSTTFDRRRASSLTPRCQVHAAAVLPNNAQF